MVKGWKLRVSFWFFFFFWNSAWFLQCIDIKVKFHRLLPGNSLNFILFFPEAPIKQYPYLKNVSSFGGFANLFSSKWNVTFVSLCWFLYLAPLFQHLDISNGLSPFFHSPKLSGVKKNIMFLWTAQDTCCTAVPNLQLTNWPVLQEESFSKFTIVYFNVCQIGRLTVRILWFYWRLETHPVPSEVNGCPSSPYSRTWTNV